MVQVRCSGELTENFFNATDVLRIVMSHAEQALLLHPTDDVIVAKTDLDAGVVVRASSVEVELRQGVKLGHKIARRAMKVGSPLRRYGQVIGFATTDIEPGDHVHLHNLGLMLGDQQYEVGVDVRPVDFYPASQMRYFEGFKRTGGRVGTRNYVAVLSTVNCSASVAQFVRERFKDVKRDYPNIDGVIALTHKSGCGQVLGGEDHRALERVLAGYAQHPNVAAYIVTKYLAGHSDLVAGAACSTRERIRRDQRTCSTSSAGAWTRAPASCSTAGSRPSPCASARRTPERSSWPARCPDIRASSACATRACPRTPRTSAEALVRGAFGAMVSFVPRGGVEAAEGSWVGCASRCRR